MASAAEHENVTATGKDDIERRGSVARTEKNRWERLWPVIACGAGLFSDGYLNNVCPFIILSAKAMLREAAKPTY